MKVLVKQLHIVSNNNNNNRIKNGNIFDFEKKGFHLTKLCDTNHLHAWTKPKMKRHKTENETWTTQNVVTLTIVMSFDLN